MSKYVARGRIMLSTIVQIILNINVYTWITYLLFYLQMFQFPPLECFPFISICVLS